MASGERGGCLGWLFGAGGGPAPSASGPPAGTCEMDDTGVRRYLQDGTCEAVRWDTLSAVALMTTDVGPFGPDVFWALSNGDGTGCVIPDQAEIAPALLARLQQLPGFDNTALIQAMSSTENARFELWSKA